MGTEAEVLQMNQHIVAGTLLNDAGEKVAEPVEGLLVRLDGRVAYPVRHGIPILLREESFPWPPESVFRSSEESPEKDTTLD
jgi:uncharacterized protein YbaR (Trm112 family)